MTPLEVDNWCLNLKKLSSVRHKNILLRAAHGEIYSKEKLARFGLIQDQQCPRCGLVEDLRHKLIDCEYTKRIWGVAFGKSNPTGYDLDIENRILGAFRGCTATKLTLHAEILLRLSSLKDDQNYLLNLSWTCWSQTATWWHCACDDSFRSWGVNWNRYRNLNRKRNLRDPEQYACDGSCHH